jgi:hypothetical protein
MMNAAQPSGTRHSPAADLLPGEAIVTPIPAMKERYDKMLLQALPMERRTGIVT